MDWNVKHKVERAKEVLLDMKQHLPDRCFHELAMAIYRDLAVDGRFQSEQEEVEYLQAICQAAKELSMGSN